jgi:Protein of unknown function (DUF2510)
VAARPLPSFCSASRFASQLNPASADATICADGATRSNMTSPAGPPSASSPFPPGWYRDPDGGDGWRWWDGTSWTASTSAGGNIPSGPSGPKAWLFGRPWRAATAIWVTLFLFINVTTGNSLSRYFELARSGRTTIGTVTGLQPSNHDGCTYEYQVARSTYSRSEATCGTGRTVGSSVTVTYLPGHPGTATTRNAVSTFWEALLFVLGAPTLLALLVFFGVRRRLKR